MNELSGDVQVPASVPVGRLWPLDGRGETFFRHHTGGEPGAPTLLLLHGWTATADLQWCTAYEELARTYPFIAIDHRGHGRGIRSSAPFTLEDAADDAAALLVALGAGPVIVVGYSMGGPIALTLASRHPHLVSALVLQATAMGFTSGRGDRVRAAFRPLMESAFRSRLGARVARRGLRRAVKANPQLAPWEPWLAGELRRAEPAAMTEAGRALGAFDGRAMAAAVSVPAGVLLTTKDQLVPPARQRDLARSLRAEVVELVGDHYCFWHKGAEFAAATDRLVASVAARIRSVPTESAPPIVSTVS